MPSIIGNGADWFKQVGTEKSTGTKLVSVSGAVKRPGNYEIELGITARDIVYGLAGGPPDGREVKCWFPGGSSAPVLLPEDLDLPYDFESMAEAGSMLGSGAIIVVDDETPIVDLALRLAQFYRHESCGKCTPCREGTNWTVKMLERIDNGEATPIDLEIMAQVQENIMGNCLCVLGDSMAMPVGLDDREAAPRVRGAHGAGARRPRYGDIELGAGDLASAGPLGPTGPVYEVTAAPMPRPEKKFVTFEIDGREVSAPEGSMLVDGAKYGDVEIPVFCYEPKLGSPVGACRMCLVEIEGIPKLQTACSTPVKDGMVVTTTSDRVKNAQEAVVEFLLVNHPLDCPVCDKGGECPLQDIAFGWGPGRSRFIEPKRHFEKPLELSPLIAIDRERCILCYRCVRFSQEIAEDYQLVFLERGDHTYVGTHNGHPYVGPFSGNIVELCPVGALTSTAYRFRARPWDIEGAGSVCTLCPSQCNVTFTVRDDTKVLRVDSRMNERRRRRLALRQGPLRLPDHQLRRAHHAADGARRRHAAPRLLGARAERGRVGARQGGRARGRARRRRVDERGGLPRRGPHAQHRWARPTWTRARADRSTATRRASSRAPTCRPRSGRSTTPPPCS